MNIQNGVSFVPGYSSATVLDFHELPCTDETLIKIAARLFQYAAIVNLIV